MWLVVGLGNPGRQYQGNRHNIGFQVVDELVSRTGAGPLRGKFGAELGEAALASQRALLCKPMEFMNLSGQSVVRVSQFWKVPVERMVVVHDELDLPFGRLKLGAGGGHGGHNGVRSLLANLGDPAFVRVRVGVGRPTAERDPADHLLTDFSREELKEVPALVALAADAVEEIVGRGLTSAMNRFNVRKKTEKKSTTGDST